MTLETNMEELLNIDTEVEEVTPVKSSKVQENPDVQKDYEYTRGCLLYTSPSPRDPKTSRMPSSA